MPQHHDPAHTPSSPPVPPAAGDTAVDKATESVAGEEDPGAADDPTSHSSALKPPPVPQPPGDSRGPGGRPA
jgi:hypothetical protein